MGDYKSSLTNIRASTVSLIRTKSTPVKTQFITP